MLITYPDNNNLSTYAASFSQRANFECFHSIGLQGDDYTASSRGLTAAKWGNRTIRTATRRRHADSRLLVLPNPHRYRCGGRRRDLPRCRWAAAGPGGAIHSGLAPLVQRPPEGPEGQAAVLVGGGGVWPGLETRRIVLSTTGPTGVEGAGGTGGHGRASRRGAERSEAAQPRGRPGPPAPAIPVGPQAQATQRAPTHAETPPRGCGTGFSLPSRV